MLVTREETRSLKYIWIARIFTRVAKTRWTDLTTNGQIVACSAHLRFSATWNQVNSNKNTPAAGLDFVCFCFFFWLNEKPRFSTHHFIGLCVVCLSGEMPFSPYARIIISNNGANFDCVFGRIWMVFFWSFWLFSWMAGTGHGLGNRTGVWSNTWPQVGAFLCHWAGDGGALHFTLVIDNYTRIVLKIDEHPVSPSERFSLPNHNSGHNLNIATQLTSETILWLEWLSDIIDWRRGFWSD